MIDSRPVGVAPASQSYALTDNADEEAYQRLLTAARQLMERVHQREEEVRRLLRVTENINRGLSLEEVLEFLYQELQPIIPFNRIGCALIDDEQGQVAARWARSDRTVYLGKGFRAPLGGSTLEDIVRTGHPRILNDLPDYLRQKPQSTSTELIVREGMQSSLTCPLVVQGRPVGFLFFSSEQRAAYSRAHVEFFQQIAGQLSLIVEKGRLYSELAEQAALIDRQNRQLLQQLDVARQFQRAMIPSESLRVPNLELAFVYRPAMEVGGDMLDIVPLADGKSLVFVGDAMGHGVEAAMEMAAAKTALLTAVHGTADPSELLRRVNGELLEMLFADRYVTAVCGRLDSVNGRADIALAGHVSPIHISAATGAMSRPGDPDNPLGLRSEASFPSVTCSFAPGDTLILFTDGLVEARNAARQLYGEERLLDVVHRHAGEPPVALLHAIEDDLREHGQGTADGDDLTVLIVQSAPDVNAD